MDAERTVHCSWVTSIPGADARSTQTDVTTPATPTSGDGRVASLELDHIVFERAGRKNSRRHLAACPSRAVLGRPGGKRERETTLLRIAAMYEHPSSGMVRVLGEQLGRTDVRRLRQRIGYASAAAGADFRLSLTATEVVMTAEHAALEPWWHQYSDADRDRARDCSGRLGVAALVDRSLGTLLLGEQQRVFLARTLMNDPGIVLLDEPSARLDLGGREQLVGALDDLAADPQGPPFVLVTHHVDEIPHGMTHALLLKDGTAVAQGPIAEAVSEASLSECFGLRLALERRPDGRLSAWARR